MKYALEHVNCDLCGSYQYKVRYRKPDDWLRLNQFEYPVVECVACGLVYVNPRPTTEAMITFYPENYHYGRNNSEWLARYEVEMSFLPRLTNEKILDIGCARGEFLSYLRKTYPKIDAHGLDFFSDGVDSKDITFHNKSLTDVSFDGLMFDIITAWAVFEHLHSPSLYFEEIYRILKEDGRLLFLVTNSESLYGRKAYLEDIPRHLYHFSGETLKKYGDRYGFKVTKIVYDDRIWDGRGVGAFYHLCQNLTGVTWEKRYFGKINRVQNMAGSIGKMLDKIIFRTHWEARLKRSGIMVVEFMK